MTAEATVEVLCVKITNRRPTHYLDVHDCVISVIESGCVPTECYPHGTCTLPFIFAYRLNNDELRDAPRRNQKIRRQKPI